MYVFDDRVPPKIDQSTFGTGGKIAYDSAVHEGFSLHAAYYLTTDFGLRHSDDRRVDAYMFDVDKRPYSILGEASLSYKADDFSLILGRQEIDTPIISTYDYRIIPNLFEAYSYIDRHIPHTTLTLSYVSKMSGLDGLVSFKHFKSMSQQTYTSLSMSDLRTVDTDNGETIDPSRITGDQGVIMSGFVYDNGIKLQGWNYYCPETLNTWYTDLSYPYTISEQWNATLEAQAYGVHEVGKFGSFLHDLGLNASYELYGIKGSIENKESGITTSLALNRFSGGDHTITAFGNWGGYPEYVAIPYMFPHGDAVAVLPKAQMGKLGFKFDLSHMGLKDQTMNIGYSIIDLEDAILPDSNVRVSNFIYKAKVDKNFHFKAQYEQRSSNYYRYADDMLTLSATYRF